MVKTEIFCEYKGLLKFNMYNIKNVLDCSANISDDFIKKNFLTYKYIPSKKWNKSYYCFNYALNNKSFLFVEDCINYLIDNYILIKKKNIRKNDIIAFADNFDFLHFAKVSKIIKKNIFIKAKLGQYNIYEYNINDNFLICGDRYIIFRKKI